MFGPPAWMNRGMFEGHNTRFSLEVAQEPIHGRRKTEKDRRPLAHCPVLRMRIMDCKMQPNGAWNEEEIDINDIECSHLVCAADLCSPSTPTSKSTAPARSSSAFSQSPRSSFYATSTRKARPCPPLSPEASGFPGLSGSRAFMTSDHAAHHIMTDMLACSSSCIAENSYGLQSHPQSYGILPNTGLAEPSNTSEHTASPLTSPTTNGSRYIMPGITRERSMDRYGEEAAETSRPMHTSKKAKPDAGRNLYGTLHIPGVRVPAMDSSIGLWFLFEDLTIRHEGT
ncbi:MAG: hypothetical protein TREMPRED_005312 [Tremellales sp. Tagirdzhanova-0007]|nr:MAG: hypothetical protein TREMPRED_005312 [Tremellales sp. Tagirdzhanova-0007]